MFVVISLERALCCVDNCDRVCALLRRSGTSYRQHASKTSQRNAEAVHAYSQASRKELCDPAPSNHVAVPTVRVQVARGGLWELPLKAGYVVPVFKVCPWGWVSKKNPTCAANSSTSAGPKERRAAPAPQGNKTYARIGEFQKPEFQKPELGAGGRQKHAGESFGGVTLRCSSPYARNTKFALRHSLARRVCLTLCTLFLCSRPTPSRGTPLPGFGG